MYIEVLETDNTKKLENYLGIIELLILYVNYYNNYQLQYKELIESTKILCKDIKLDNLYNEIIRLLKTFPDTQIIYKKDKYN